MQTVKVQGAWRADKTAQVCLWAKLPDVGEVYVVSGETIVLPLTTEVTDAIAQGRLVVLPELDTRVVVDRVVDVGSAPEPKRGREPEAQRGRK